MRSRPVPSLSSQSVLVERDAQRVLQHVDGHQGGSGGERSHLLGAFFHPERAATHRVNPHFCGSFLLGFCLVGACRGFGGPAFEWGTGYGRSWDLHQSKAYLNTFQANQGRLTGTKGKAWSSVRISTVRRTVYGRTRVKDALVTHFSMEKQDK